MLLMLLVVFVLFLAFSNGANDNFKGFATVWGSATLNYRRALIIATIAAIAGSLLSVLLAHGLVKQFSGKGLVPDGTVGTQEFALAVAAGASFTVMLATRIGLPISTTHALTGGLVGAGLALGTGDVDFSKLGSAFFLPLLLSPVISALLGFIVCKLMPRYKAETDCICIAEPAFSTQSQATAMSATLPHFKIASNPDCAADVHVLAGVSVSGALDKVHIASAATICFARSVNDTPKLAGLLVVANFTNGSFQLIGIALAMALGGWLLSRRVAETMSQKITPLSPHQGVPANLITAVLVLAASKFGLPVSTTHVAVGAISGVGAGAGTLSWSTIGTILLSWVATLPIAAGFAWGMASILGARIG
jgi:inorganic phosphate transporter, PiT family